PGGWRSGRRSWRRGARAVAEGMAEATHRDTGGATSRRGGRAFVVVALAAPLLVPVAVFMAVALASGMGVGGAIRALLEQSSGRRQNPVTVGILGLAPVGVLLAGLWAAGKRGLGPDRRRGAAWGGLAAILLVLVWVNAQFWGLFLPDRVYPGFPHGLELVIGPLFFAPVALVVGAVFGALLAGSDP
ncbi:MAG TPA: hypothetical protein VLA43_11270, partial [Longimicrobiales bacterium]|nr:hypothetical protein [Longimicrobiales bacterium]